ncbi:MAG: hypothetical protein HOV71_06135, partial [Hamadaea sp.]|nr:hypothetical protein [Hamadaea sp.]
MNKWLFRAVGTVGVASGIWLLGGAAAHAHEATAAPVTDPQALRGLLDNIFSPTNGLSDLGFSVDLPGNGVDAGLDANAPLQLRSNDGRTGVTAHLPQRQDVFFGGRLPSLANSVPAVAMLPERTEGLPGLSNLADGLTGGGGAGGILGGLTGSSGPLNVVSGLTRGGLTSGLTGGLTGGSAGGTEAPGGDLLGGLTGGDSGGVLSGLTGGDSGGILG